MTGYMKTYRDGELHLDYSEGPPPFLRAVRSAVSPRRQVRRSVAILALLGGALIETFEVLRARWRSLTAITLLVGIGLTSAACSTKAAQAKVISDELAIVLTLTEPRHDLTSSQRSRLLKAEAQLASNVAALGS